jgi:hypothetical protein
MMRLVKLHCGHEFHGNLEISTPRLGRTLGRMIVYERPCRSCSRLKSSATVGRRVYHRWDGNGSRLKDRTVRVIRT